MKTNYVRGSAVLLNIITVLLLLLFAWVVGYPKYEQAKLKKNFKAAIDAGEVLYNAAQTFYIEKHIWPAAVSDLRTNLDAKRISDWEIANKNFSCELSYGQGMRNKNDIRCSPIGKYASALHYQIVLSGNTLHKRFCQAIKTNQKANDMCKAIGGTFSHNMAGDGTTISVYVVNK
ncbi:hypothetical protein [Candidatus Avelusimicrobium caledoniensis]|uniref:hypothetical protein n=1 Tax=Candidatus Avelusimicrobium caledoniensis TaxID=3416220 RepID=UPI003D0EA9A2